MARIAVEKVENGYIIRADRPMKGDAVTVHGDAQGMVEGLLRRLDLASEWDRVEVTITNGDGQTRKL